MQGKNAFWNVAEFIWAEAVLVRIDAAQRALGMQALLL
jgi:hypothetical protein